MEDGADRARRYRYRAEELRAIAQDWIDADAMMALAKLAWQYEKMADDLERARKPDVCGQYRSP